MQKSAYLYQTNIKYILSKRFCMKKVIGLLSILFSFLIAGTALNMNFRWPWEKEQYNEPITYRIRSTNNINYEIKLIQGDLLNLSLLIQPGTKQPYTIVNAANKFLYLGDGIAGAIKAADKKSGVQKACNKLLEEYGKQNAKPISKKTGFFSDPIMYKKSMPTGTAWLTESSDLKTNNNIQAIIHAVGPDCREEQEGNQFEHFLRMTYGNIVAAAINYNFKHQPENSIATIACPSLSTGIFSCDLDQSAAIAAEMIFSIMRNVAQSNNPHAPTTFVMVAYDNLNFEAYKKAFQDIAQTMKDDVNLYD